jgi:hypothetical protein
MRKNTLHDTNSLNAECFNVHRGRYEQGIKKRDTVKKGSGQRFKVAIDEILIPCFA